MFSSPVLNAFSLNGNGKTHSCLSGDARLSHSPLLPLVLLTKPVIIVGYLKHTSMSGKTEFLFEKEVLLKVEIPLEAMKLRCSIILSGCRVCKWSYSTSLDGLQVLSCSLDDVHVTWIRGWKSSVQYHPSTTIYCSSALPWRTQNSCLALLYV